jgi:hypothetical protein
MMLMGLALREAFSFWTGHPFDFELWVRLGYYTTHLYNPYGFLPAAPGLSFSNIFSSSAGATIGYLPFWPFITSSIYYLYSATGIQNRFLYYFLLKQPIILSDLLVAYLLYKYCVKVNSSAAAGAMKFWLFVPFSVIISAIWGMFDSVALVFVMLSLLSKDMKRSFWNGLSIFVKSIPVIYAIPMSSLKVGRLLLSISIPSLVSLFIVYLTGWPFAIVSRTLGSTITKEGESMSIWELYYIMGSLNLLRGISSTLSLVLGLVWIPALIISTYFAYKRFGFDSDHGLVQSCIMLTLVFFIFKSQVNEQYFLYLLLLMLLDVTIWNNNRKRLMYYMTMVATIYLIVNNFFMLDFISPVYPAILNTVNNLNQLIGNIRYSVKLFLGVIFTVLNILYIRAQIKTPDRELGRYDVHAAPRY